MLAVVSAFPAKVPRSKMSRFYFRLEAGAKVETERLGGPTVPLARRPGTFAEDLWCRKVRGNRQSMGQWPIRSWMVAYQDRAVFFGDYFRTVCLAMLLELVSY